MQKKFITVRCVATTVVARVVVDVLVHNTIDWQDAGSAFGSNVGLVEVVYR